MEKSEKLEKMSTKHELNMLAYILSSFVMAGMSMASAISILLKDAHMFAISSLLFLCTLLYSMRCTYKMYVRLSAMYDVNGNELDRLADSKNPNNPHGDNYEAGCYFGFQDGFAAGYEHACCDSENNSAVIYGTDISDRHKQ